MTITPFLARQPFDPEIIAVMSTAFTAVCGALGLKPGDDPATRIIAEKIIEFAQRGVRDAATLQSMTLSEFDPRQFERRRNPVGDKKKNPGRMRDDRGDQNK